MKNVTLSAGVAPPRQARPRGGAPAAAQAVVGAPAASKKLCRVCRSPQVVAIDAALAKGGSERAVAQAFGVSKSAMHRHKASCLSSKLALAAAERSERVSAASLLDAMIDLQKTTQEQLEHAIAGKTKPADVARLIREARENVALMGRFLGAFAGERATVDNRVQVVALREMSVDELRALTAALRAKA